MNPLFVRVRRVYSTSGERYATMLDSRRHDGREEALSFWDQDPQYTDYLSLQWVPLDFVKGVDNRG